jgi:hypothetical protein
MAGEKPSLALSSARRTAFGDNPNHSPSCASVMPPRCRDSVHNCGRRSFKKDAPRAGGRCPYLQRGRPGRRTRRGHTIMNTTQNTTTKRVVAALGVAAAAAVTPALLFAGAGTAHADCSCDASCSPFPSISNEDWVRLPRRIQVVPPVDITRSPLHRCGRSRNLCRVHLRGPTCRRRTRSAPSSMASGSSGAGDRPATA